jgi:hypothetical protein
VRVETRLARALLLKECAATPTPTRSPEAATLMNFSVISAAAEHVERGSLRSEQQPAEDDHLGRSAPLFSTAGAPAPLAAGAAPAPPQPALSRVPGARSHAHKAEQGANGEDPLAWRQLVGSEAEPSFCANGEGASLISGPSVLPDILSRYESRIRAILGPHASPQELAPLLEPARLSEPPILTRAAPLVVVAHDTVTQVTPTSAIASEGIPPNREPLAPPSPVAKSGRDGAASADEEDGEPLTFYSIPSVRGAQKATDDKLVIAPPEAPLRGYSELRAFESASLLQQQSPQPPAVQHVHRQVIVDATAEATSRSTRTVSSSARPLDALLVDAVAAAYQPHTPGTAPRIPTAFAASLSQHASSHPANSSVERQAASHVVSPEHFPMTPRSVQTLSSRAAPGKMLRWLGLPPAHISDSVSPEAAGDGRRGVVLQQASPLTARNLGAVFSAHPSSGSNVEGAVAKETVTKEKVQYTSEDDALYEPTPMPRAWRSLPA